MKFLAPFGTSTTHEHRTTGLLSRQTTENLHDLAGPATVIHGQLQ